MRTRSAKLDQSTSTQPAPTSPSSSSHLPPELIAQIQRLAEDDCESVAERKKVRSTMELVCKDWYRAVDPLAHVILEAASDVARLRSKLRSSKLRAVVGAMTKAVSVDLDGFRAAAAGQQLGGLLKWFTQADRLHLEGLFSVGRAQPVEEIMTSVIEALAHLAQVRHLSFGEATCQANHVQK